MEDTEGLKGEIEKLIKQISEPQSFQVYLQRNRADIESFRKAMVRLVDSLESRLREIEQNVAPSVSFDITDLQDLKGSIEKLIEQISQPQSFHVYLQRDSAEIESFRKTMARLADLLESRLREIEQKVPFSVSFDISSCGI